MRQDFQLTEQSKDTTLQEVISCAAKLGLSGLQLPALVADIDAEDSSRQRRRSGTSAGAEADADIMAAQLREQLASRLRAAPQQGPPEAWACLEVCALDRACSMAIPCERHTP